jgi:3-deoxy-manno-octulosonate cytidylyltransferase (CMP-KDO synthetase)
MKVIGIIPARYGSTRFPGKPLAMIGNKPMIQWVYEAATKAIEEVWIATDDERIVDAIKAFGGRSIRTSSSCRNGTERCAEIISRYTNPSTDDIVVNIQGDQPFINPEYIKGIIRCFKVGNPDIVTLTCPLRKEHRNNPNCVKVYVTEGGKAKNFTRQVIFHPGLQVFKHIGIYAYKAEVLLDIVRLEETEQERGLHLEQLRWLQKYQITCTYVLNDVISVDTPEDLIRAEKHLKSQQK